MNETTAAAKKPEFRDNIVIALLAIVVMGIALGSYLRVQPYIALPFDDSYIHHVFSQNLFQTGYLTFNGKTPTSGATSPLYVFVLAVVRAFVTDPVLASFAIGIVCHLLTVLLTALLLHRLGCARWVRLGTVVLMASNGFLIVDALNGLETSLFHLLSMTCIALWLKGANGKAAIPFGLALGALAATRPEGIFFAVTLVIAHGWRRMRAEKRLWPEPFEAARLLVPLALVLLAFRWQDLWVGNTASAKLVLFGELSDPFDEKMRTMARSLSGFWLPHLGWLLCAVAGMIVRSKEKTVKVPASGRVGVLPLAWCGAMAAIYTLYLFVAPSSLTHLDYRYQHVFLPPVLFFCGLAVDGFLRSEFSTRRMWTRVAVGLLCMLSLVHGHRSSRELYRFFTQVSRNALLPTANWVAANTPPGTRVAAHDIGALGYISKRPVLDLSGLVNLDVRPHVASETVHDYLREARPGYVVVLPEWAYDCLTLDPTEEPGVYIEVYRSQMAYGEPYVVYRCDWPDAR